MQDDTIVKGKDDNPVVLVFNGIDLTTLIQIEVKLGNDVRTLTDGSGSVVVASSSELELNFYDTNETTASYWCINFTRANGKVKEVTSKCMGNLSKPKICEGC